MVVIAIAALFLLSFLKNQIVKAVVGATITEVTGVKNSMGSFSISFLKQSVRIRDLRLYNPEGFPKDVLAHLPEISVDYNLPALLRGKLYFSLLVIDLKELVVVRNNFNKFNVDALRVAVAKHLESGDKQLPLQIDLMTLNAARVVYKDFAKPQGTEPTTQVFNINFLDKTFKNITSAQQLAVLVIAEAMKPTAIQGVQMYSAAAFSNLGLIPKGIVNNLLGKDDATEDFAQSFAKVYQAAFAVAQKLGQEVAGNKNIGLIKCKIDGAEVKVNVNQVTNNRVKVVVSARKMLLPQSGVASGVLYQISERLK